MTTSCLAFHWNGAESQLALIDQGQFHSARLSENDSPSYSPEVVGIPGEQTSSLGPRLLTELRRALPPATESLPGNMFFASASPGDASSLAPWSRAAELAGFRLLTAVPASVAAAAYQLRRDHSSRRVLSCNFAHDGCYVDLLERQEQGFGIAASAVNPSIADIERGSLIGTLQSITQEVRGGELPRSNSKKITQRIPPGENRLTA